MIYFCSHPDGPNGKRLYRCDGKEYALCDLCEEQPDRAIKVIEARRKKEWEEQMREEEAELGLDLD